MYLEYFGFDSYPFAVTPDPSFLYLSRSHREALGHLLYGAGEHGGFVALIGEVGTGKTTLIRAVVANDTPNLDVALCWNPHLGVTEFVGTICDELGVSYDAERDTTLKALVDRLNQHLLEAHAANRRTVLIIDEAQNLSREVLEQLRLLTNLETHKDKLLRVILVGQPELEGVLARHDLRQLAQRITARFRLQPLGVAETRAYVQHRLARAGGPQHLFSRSAIVMLCALTRGVPRLINMVCERALMGTYAHGRAYVGPWTVLRAAMETLPARPRRVRSRWWRFAVPTGAIALIGIVVGLAWLPDIPLTNAAEWIRGAKASGDQVAQADDSGKDSQTKTATEASKKDSAASDSKANAPTATAQAQDTDKNKDAKDPDPADAQKSGSKPDVKDADKTSHDPKSDAGAKSDDPSKKSDKNQSKDQSKDKQSPKKDTFTLPKGNADINQVLRLWGVFGAQIRSGCSDLHVGDLRCLDDTGDFATVRRYNRPALLILNEKNHHQTVLLSGVNKDGTVTLVGGDGTRDVDRDRLLKLWTGRFEVVWRSDAGVALIQPGSVGNAVVWLRKRLMQIDGKNPDNQVGKPSPVYDDALGKRLKAFQKSHNLKPDGIAGPRTQMMLNGAVPSPGAPSLTPVKPSEKK
ncbi:ExeA family protein [Salinisphaera hydrothermalis]|uniref:General secretion pathway protein-related protein, ATPase n=1 Tax=Salinisphaera hydrothermalis (strain C41B8) TaxID=1304275 RepID=A0A084IQN8_SALHC|nr:AAA family ATPase [Salinisphaera hydrothermalis]KEZ79022.1 general secretion pathway protein-related protein, ATPase [Salinisphaera hydrothermalis C41B8]